jgi:hypothetical protein
MGLCPNPDYPDAISPTLGPLDLPLLAAALEGAAESLVNFIADALGFGSAASNNAPVSSYSNTTAPGASVTNFTTDVTAQEASATLQSNGFSSSVSADGNATIFTQQGSGTYVIRPSNSAPGGAAMDYFPINGNPPSKINFGP